MCTTCLPDSYCKRCWGDWKDWSTYLLDQTLSEPERYEGRTVHNHKGKSVHILQIGLGTFGTFLHNDTYWMEVLLEATSKRKSEPLRAIGVDPVEDSSGPMESLALAQRQRYVSITQAAVGDHSGQVLLYCLPHAARLKLRNELLRKNPKDIETRAFVDKELAYLESMSSIDIPHPDFCQKLLSVKEYSKTAMQLMETRRVQLFSFSDLLQYHNCRGCQVLIIDAEGADCTILRSMLSACTGRGRIRYPWVIRFETRGHGDYKERDQHEHAEESTVEELRKHGYLLLQADGDTTLIHGPAMHRSRRLARWADKHFTYDNLRKERAHHQNLRKDNMRKDSRLCV